MELPDFDQNLQAVMYATKRREFALTSRAMNGKSPKYIRPCFVTHRTTERVQESFVEGTEVVDRFVEVHYLAPLTSAEHAEKKLEKGNPIDYNCWRPVQYTVWYHKSLKVLENSYTIEAPPELGTKKGFSKRPTIHIHANLRKLGDGRKLSSSYIWAKDAGEKVWDPNENTESPDVRCQMTAASMGILKSGWFANVIR